MTTKYYKNFENFLKKYFYRDSRLGGILPNNPTRLLPIGDPPPGCFRFSPIARDFTH